jgi:hypothetical protein
MTSQEPSQPPLWPVAGPRLQGYFPAPFGQMSLLGCFTALSCRPEPVASAWGEDLFVSSNAPNSAHRDGGSQAPIHQREYFTRSHGGAPGAMPPRAKIS